MPAIGVDAPFPFAPVATQTALEAYESVLRKAGATWPKRDALDARIVDEVRASTAAFGGVYAGPMAGTSARRRPVGGWPKLNSAPRRRMQTTTGCRTPGKRSTA